MQLSTLMVPNSMPMNEKSSSVRLTVSSSTLATVMFLAMSEPTGSPPKVILSRPLYSPANCSSMGYVMSGLSVVSVTAFAK